MNGPETHNRIGGHVAGSVVQAGAVNQVVLYPQSQEAVTLVPRQLPSAVGDFTGRDAEVAVLDGLLSRDRGGGAGGPLVALVDGTAGVGKTSLAVWWGHHVQHRFPDGTLFVDLCGHGPSTPVDAGLVLASFLQALGIAKDRVPGDSDTQSALYRSLLAERKVLVILDNAVSAEQVRPLLPATTGCAALVTSRRVLTGLVVTESATRLQLGLLTPADAVELTARVIGRHRVVVDPRAVAALVELCARLPLALRVAASRVSARPHMTVADVVADLADGRNGLDALSVTGDDRSEVRTVFDWSYTCLAVEHGRTFRLLGLHPGTEFSVSAVAALTGLDEALAYRHLEALADLHLVEPVARRRYWMHDLLHAFAAHRAQLDDMAEHRHAAVTAVLSWYAQVAVAADTLVFPANPSLVVPVGEASEPPVVKDRRQALAWLITEHATLQTSLRQAHARGAFREAMAIASAMRFLVLRNRAWWSERITAEALGCDAARACRDRRIETVFLLRTGDTLQQIGDWQASDADLHAALVLAERLGDMALRGDALTGLGRNHVLQQRFAEAEPYYREALPLVRGQRGGYVEAVVHANLALIKNRLGRHHEALDHAEQELMLRQVIGVSSGIGYSLHNVAMVHQSLGNHHAVVELCDQALALFRSYSGSEQYTATALETLSTSLLHLGDHTGARECLVDAIAILTDLDDPHADTLRGRPPLRSGRPRIFTETAR